MAGIDAAQMRAAIEQINSEQTRAVLSELVRIAERVELLLEDLGERIYALEDNEEDDE